MFRKSGPRSWSGLLSRGHNFQDETTDYRLGRGRSQESVVSDLGLDGFVSSNVTGFLRYARADRHAMLQRWSSNGNHDMSISQGRRGCWVRLPDGVAAW